MMLAILLSLAIAQPVGTPCATGRNCRLNNLSVKRIDIRGDGSGTVAGTVANFTYWFWGNTCYQYANGTGMIVAPSSCTLSLLGGDLYLASGMRLNGATTATTSLAAPATFGFGLATDNTSKRVWKSDSAKWTEVGGGQHPVTQSPAYFYVMDRAAGSSAPAWAVAPRSGAASVAFTSAGTLTSGTTTWSEPYASYATTAVSGNQAHHSTAVCVGPSTRWSARVGFGALGSFTSTRAFFGLSATLPLTAGSSTPTADAAVFRADTTIGANWYACSSDGTAALTCTDTGVAVGFATDVSNTLEIDCREGNAVGVPAACTYWINGRPYVRRTTSLPNAAVGSTASVETLTAATRSFFLGTAVSLEPQLRVTP